MSSAEVLEALYLLLLSRGKREYLRSDNGPEFISAPFKEWLLRVGDTARPDLYPGSPWENGYNERFNGTLRQEALNAGWFTLRRQAQVVINQWLRQCNHIRCHDALGIRPTMSKTLLETYKIRGADQHFSGMSHLTQPSQDAIDNVVTVVGRPGNGRAAEAHAQQATKPSKMRHSISVRSQRLKAVPLVYEAFNQNVIHPSMILSTLLRSKLWKENT